MNLVEILNKYRKQIVDEWIYRPHTEVSERYCGRPDGYILENGGAVLEGSSQELVDNPDVKSAYFGL